MAVLNAPEFLDDWREHLRHALSRNGFADAFDIPRDDPLTIEERYFDAMGRLIEPRPRRVYEARGFRVPNPLKRAYYDLRHKITEGEDLRPHQSRRALQSATRDDLFNDWGIQHLHLGRRVQEDGLVERTSPVVLGVFRADDAFILSVEEHGSAHPLLFSDARHLEVIARNWPHLLRPFANEANETALTQPSPREIREARRSGVPLTVVLSDEVAYDPPGGGVHPKGSGNRAVALAEQFRDRVHTAQTLAMAHFDELVAMARARGLVWDETLTLRLHVSSELWANIEGTPWYWLLEPAHPICLEERRTQRAKAEKRLIPAARRRLR
jgi:hypothetical protein